MIDNDKPFNYDSILNTFHHGIDKNSEMYESLFKIDYLDNEKQKKTGLDSDKKSILLRKTKNAIEIALKIFKEKK